MRLFRFVILVQGICISISFGIDFWKLTLKDLGNAITQNMQGLSNTISSTGYTATRPILENDDKTDIFNQYVKHITKEGYYTLKDIGQKIMKLINVDNKVIEEINAAPDNYIIRIQNYSTFVTRNYRNRSRAMIDEEFLIRNVLETASEFIYDQQLNFLSNTTREITDDVHLTDNISFLIRNIYKLHLKRKKTEIQYICNEYNICPVLSPITKLFESYITTLLDLPNKQLTLLMAVLKTEVQNNRYFLEFISGARNNDKVMEDIVNLFELNNIKESLTVIRVVLNQRFKIINSPFSDLSVRIQAARILLDLIDKTFEDNQDDIIILDFDTVLVAVKMYNYDNSLINPAVHDFVNKVFKIISVPNNPIEGALIETIVRGNIENDALNLDWFKDGFKGVYTAH